MTGVEHGSVGAVLHRLEKRVLVRYVDPDWTLGEDHHLPTYGMIRHSMDTFDARFGEENIDAPLEHAEDE